MATPIIMPRQGQSVESCILGVWHKKAGESVNDGDLLFSYETDKAAFEEEAKVGGTLLATYYSEGDEVPVLSVIGVIGEPGESADAVQYVNSSQEKEQAVPAASATHELVVADQSAVRVKISPLARSIAKNRGIDPLSITGSGPGGRIIARDVEEIASSTDDPTPAAGKTSAFTGSNNEYELKPLSNMRRLIAQSMHRSLQTAAQLTHHTSADARALLAGRKKLKDAFERGEISDNITINDMVCFATILALKQFPLVNSHFTGDAIRQYRKVHLGLAVDTDRGLMVPALRQADNYSLAGISHELRQLANQCRKGNISPDLLHPEAASFTISNLGNYGIEMFTPVLNLPQTAILGVCSISIKPKDLGDGTIGFIPQIGLSLTYDHRALDGGEASRFLASVVREIEQLSTGI